MECCGRWMVGARRVGEEIALLIQRAGKRRALIQCLQNARYIICATLDRIFKLFYSPQSRRLLAVDKPVDVSGKPEGPLANTTSLQFPMSLAHSRV